MDYMFDKPQGYHASGLRLFNGNKDLNPEFTKHSEQFGGAPRFPRPLLGENVNLGEKWDQLLFANIHQDLVGAITNQILTTSQEYHYSVITLHSGDWEPAIYGDNSQMMTRSVEYFHGTLETLMPMGIFMPRGMWEEGVESFTEWWNVQVKNMEDTLLRGAQAGVFFRILNNFDGMRYNTRKNKQPMEKLTVQNYYEKFDNPVVNCFRRLNGFQKFITHDKKYMRTAFPESTQDGKSQSWIFMVSSDADEFAKFYKQENYLYLFSGKQRRDYPEISMLDYSTTAKIDKDALFVVDNFHHKKELNLGSNILCRYNERPRYYRFKPWNMLNKKKVSLDEYDICIIDDIEKNKECQVKYIDAVKVLPLDDIHKFFGLKTKKIGNVDAITFHQLVEATIKTKTEELDITGFNNPKLRSVITEITKGKVKSPMGYYEYMIDAMNIDDVVNDIKSGIINGDIKFPDDLPDTGIPAGGFTKEDLKAHNIIDEHPSFKKWLNRITPLVNFLSEYIEYPLADAPTLKNMLTLFFTLYKFPNIYEKYTKLSGVDYLARVKRPNLALRLSYSNANIIQFEEPGNPNPVKVPWKDTIKKQKQIMIYFIFNKILISKGNTKKFNDIANKMLDINICMPFGIFLFKRQIYLEHDTPKVRKKSMDQRSQPLFAKVVQDPNTADIHITVTKSFGENLREPRDVKVYEGTFIQECKHGGGTKLWKKPKNGRYNGAKTFAYGDLWVVPVTLNEVLGKRIHMINRTGWDTRAEWKGVLQKLRLKDRNKGKLCYYSTWKHCVEYYKWKTLRNKVHNKGEFYFNHNLAKFNENHWAGWQKYVINNSTDTEKGPFEEWPWWWLAETPEINARIVNYNKNN